MSYQRDMLMSARNVDSLQEFMAVVEVHLIHADALAAQKIPHLKQWTIQSRQQLFFYAQAFLQGRGKSRQPHGSRGCTSIHPALHRIFIFAICLLLVRGLGNIRAGAVFENFLMAVN